MQLEEKFLPIQTLYERYWLKIVIRICDTFLTNAYDSQLVGRCRIAYLLTDPKISRFKKVCDDMMTPKNFFLLYKHLLIFSNVLFINDKKKNFLWRDIAFFVSYIIYNFTSNWNFAWPGMEGLWWFVDLLLWMISRHFHSHV